MGRAVSDDMLAYNASLDFWERFFSFAERFSSSAQFCLDALASSYLVEDGFPEIDFSWTMVALDDGTDCYSIAGFPPGEFSLMASVSCGSVFISELFVDSEIASFADAERVLRDACRSYVLTPVVSTISGTLRMLAERPTEDVFSCGSSLVSLFESSGGSVSAAVRELMASRMRLSVDCVLGPLGWTPAS